MNTNNTQNNVDECTELLELYTYKVLEDGTFTIVTNQGDKPHLYAPALWNIQHIMDIINTPERPLRLIEDYMCKFLGDCKLLAFFSMYKIVAHLYPAAQGLIDNTHNLKCFLTDDWNAVLCYETSQRVTDVNIRAARCLNMLANRLCSMIKARTGEDREFKGVTIDPVIYNLFKAVRLYMNALDGNIKHSFSTQVRELCEGEEADSEESKRRLSVVKTIVANTLKAHYPPVVDIKVVKSKEEVTEAGVYVIDLYQCSNSKWEYRDAFGYTITDTVIISAFWYHQVTNEALYEPVDGVWYIL